MALYIQLTQPKTMIDFPDKYFQKYFKSEWMYSDFTKKVIETIDKSNLTAEEGYNYNLVSRFGTMIHPYDLSTGTKVLLMLYFLNFENKQEHPRLLKFSNMGENCYPFLEEIGEYKDITIWGNCSPWGELKGIIKESNYQFNSRLEFVLEKSRLLSEGIIEEVSYSEE